MAIKSPSVLFLFFFLFLLRLQAKKYRDCWLTICVFQYRCLIGVKVSLLFCAWLGVCWCLIVRARNGPTHGPVHVTRFAATTGILFALCASSLYEHISLSEGSGANMLYVCIHMYAAYFLRAYHSVWVCVLHAKKKNVQKRCALAYALMHSQ